MGDKSIIGTDTLNPYTKSLYNLETSASDSSSSDDILSFLQKMTGTEIIKSGTVITQDTVQASTILAFISLRTNGVFQTSSLTINGSSISSSDIGGINITPFTGTSINLFDQTIMTGSATSMGMLYFTNSACA